MNIGALIRQELKKQGRSQRWLASQIDIDEITLSGKLTRNSITAEEIIKIGNILEIDLNKLKEEI